MTLIRSYNEEHKCFYYFCDGGYYSDEGCIVPLIARESFDWNNAELFTGLADKVEKKIFKGDIIKSESHTNPDLYLVDFIEGGFCATHPSLEGYPIDINHFYPSIGCLAEVVSNIHNSQELFMGAQ